eukprot:GHVP01012733.1.p1 GENE.GHVP01012733.1~~GHVP01012733.1.p1  ORF type:complete len:143 (-),score=16.33 GHVP01012733.1:623-1051(-)
MPKYYCDYCDINLTHSSPGGRRQHNIGRKHISNKIEYFQAVIRNPDFRPPDHVIENQYRPTYPGAMGVPQMLHGGPPMLHTLPPIPIINQNFVPPSPHARPAHFRNFPFPNPGNPGTPGSHNAAGNPVNVNSMPQMAPANRG